MKRALVYSKDAIMSLVREDAERVAKEDGGFVVDPWPSSIRVLNKPDLDFEVIVEIRERPKPEHGTILSATPADLAAPVWRPFVPPNYDPKRRDDPHEKDRGPFGRD